MHSSFAWDRQVGPAVLQHYLPDMPSTHDRNLTGLPTRSDLSRFDSAGKPQRGQIQRATITINFLSFFFKKKDFVNKLYS